MPQQPTPRGEGRTPGPDKGPFRVLLVTEYTLLAQGLTALLEDSPGTVVRVTALTENLPDVVREWRPEVVLIETADVRSTMRNWGPLHTDGRQVPTLVIAPGDPEQLKAALMAGARGFVPRDASGAQLLTCIEAVARGEWGLPRSFIGQLVQEYLAYTMAEQLWSLPLNDRERRILERLSKGTGTRQISTEMFLSESAVRTEIRILKQKMGVSSRSHLVAEALRRGLLLPQASGATETTSRTSQRD